MAINLKYNYSQIARIHTSFQWNAWWLMLGPGSAMHLWGCGSKPCPGCEWARGCGSPQPRMWWWRCDSVPTPETSQPRFPGSRNPVSMLGCELWGFDGSKWSDCDWLSRALSYIMSSSHWLCVMATKAWQHSGDTHLAIKVTVLWPHLPF